MKNQIQHNNPIPPKKVGRKTTSPYLAWYNEMWVGDSVDVEGLDAVRHFHTAVRRIHGAGRITARRIGDSDSYRVWKIK